MTKPWEMRYLRHPGFYTSVIYVSISCLYHLPLQTGQKKFLPTFSWSRLDVRLNAEELFSANSIVDCSQSTIFPWDRRCRSLSSTGRHLGLSMREKLGRVQKEPHRYYPRAFCTLPSFARIERQRWRPVELNDRHLRSHGKIGDCEQSNLIGTYLICFQVAWYSRSWCYFAKRSTAWRVIWSRDTLFSN